MSADTIRPIPLRDIRISEKNVRLHDVRRNIDELAASIKKHGLLQPVVLLGDYDKPPYELISGQRRFLAHQLLKEKTINAVFVGKMDRTQAIVRSLVENLQRVELEYVDTATAITELYKKFGKDKEKVQKETGLSIRRINDYILIDAQASEEMKAALKSKAATSSDVKRALRAAQGNIKKAEAILDLIIEHKPTAHQKRRLVEFAEKDQEASPTALMKQALKPHVEESIVISLSKDVREGLVKATEKMSMDPEDLASQILDEWLRDQGFLK